VKRFTLSESSRIDLDEIADFISQDSPTHAVATVRRLRQAMKMLAGASGMGKPCPDLRPDQIRMWAGVHPYLIYYRVDKGPIVVVRVVHGARDQTRIVASISRR